MIYNSIVGNCARCIDWVHPYVKDICLLTSGNTPTLKSKQPYCNVRARGIPSALFINDKQDLE